MGINWEGFRRLIESDMPIRSKSQKLEINSTGFFYDLIILTAGFLCIRIGSIRNMHILRFNIHMIKKMLMHEIPIALFILM